MIMRVVNCRLIDKQFVFWYSSLPKITRLCLCRTDFRFCDKRVQLKLNEVIFCKYCMRFVFDVGFIMIKYLKALSCS